MTIRKQLFVSNILMIIAALLILVLSMTIIGAGLRVIYNNEWQDMKNVDEHVYEVVTLMRQLDDTKDGSMERFEELAGQCGQYEYNLYVKKNGKILFSDLSTKERNAVEALDIKQLQTSSGVPRVAQTRNRTVIYNSFQRQNDRYDVVAVGQNSSLQVSRRELVEMVLATGSVLMLVAILVIILLSRFFSKKLIDRFLVPVRKLTDGAKRIQQGNFEEMIYYSGSNEFALLCGTFNDMQESLRREIEKNAVYRQSRIEMIAGISHDLRTPLTSIKGYIKGMIDGVANTPQKQRMYLETAYEKASEMDVLLQQLFLFSRLETGNLPLTRQKVSLDGYLREYCARNQDAFALRGARLRYVSYDQQAEARIDLDQMNRVFNNIIDNSIKYKVRETVKITISLYRASEEALISVKDDGGGVPEENLPYIFESYYRIHDRNGRMDEGSGLGLSIVKYIVEAHGGRLQARNREGLEILIYLKNEEKQES